MMHPKKITARNIRSAQRSPMWSSQPMQQHQHKAPDGAEKTNENKTPATPPEPKDGEQPKDGEDGEKTPPEPKPIDVTKTKAFKDEKKRADDLAAELQRLREAGMSEDEKAREASKKAEITSAVSAKETELTDHYEGVIGGLQDQIIDSIVDGLLDGAGLERKEYEDVIGSLDKRNFIKDDGSVDRDKVKKTFGQITKAATSRPPRTGGGRTTARDNGFGRYLSKD